MENLSTITRFYLAMSFYAFQSLKKIEKEIQILNEKKEKTANAVKLEKQLIERITHYMSALLGKPVEFKGIKRLRLSRIIAHYGSYASAIETINQYSVGEMSKNEQKLIDARKKEKDQCAEIITKALKEF